MARSWTTFDVDALAGPVHEPAPPGGHELKPIEVKPGSGVDQTLMPSSPSSSLTHLELPETMASSFFACRSRSAPSWSPKTVISMRSMTGFGLAPEVLGLRSSTVVPFLSTFVTMKGPVPMIGSFSSNFWISVKSALMLASFHLCFGRIGM